MKRSIWLILLLCCQSLSSIAADNLLIEQTYKRVSGEPNIYFETFYVKDGCLGSLEIYNGDSAGDNRISSASIRLNETELLSTKELNQHVGKLVKEVYFSNGDNSIDVEIASRPGSELTIFGQCYYEAEAPIDHNGGTVAVVDPKSSISGAAVKIPTGAIEETSSTVNVSIQPATWLTPESPPDLEPAGQLIDFGPDGTQFAVPVFLVLPYNDKNNDGIIDGTLVDEVTLTARRYNEENSTWEPVEIVGRDLIKNTITVETNHFSLYSPFYVANNEVSFTTNQATIFVDGDSADWSGLLSTPPTPDLEGDSVCGPGTDIKNVYTAMDTNYAYFMIETYEPISNDITISLSVDTKPGKEMVDTTYAEFGLNFHGDIGYGSSYLTSCWNDAGPVFTFMKNDEGEDKKTIWGNVFEAKIPLTFFSQDGSDIEYINITNVNIHYTDWANKCDEDKIYPSLDYFRLQYRYYMETPENDHVRLIFSQFSRFGESPEGVDYIENVSISNINDSSFDPLEFNNSDFIAFPEIDGIGYYQELAHYIQGEPLINRDIYGVFYFSPFKQTTYFIKKWPLSELDILDGDYKMSLQATDGNTYEAVYSFSDPGDVPWVEADTISCSIVEEEGPAISGDYILEEGGLACSWTIEQFESDGIDQSKYNLMAELVSYPADDSPVKFFPILLRYLKFTTGELKHDFYVPPSVLDEFLEGSAEVKLKIRSRPNDDTVRKYSKNISMNEILGLPPLQ